MNDNNTLFWIRFYMKNINFIIIMMISTLMAFTTYKIVDTMGANHFLDTVDTIPIAPWQQIVFTFFALFVLMAIMQLRGKQEWKNLSLFGYGLVQLLLCFLIMKNQNYSYNGIILLVIADLFVCWRNTRLKVFFLSVLFFIYVFSSIGVVTGTDKISIFQNYITYYNTDSRRLIMGLKSVLVSSNNLLFMLYMVMLIRVQIMENRRITLLNSQLDEANEKLQEANIRLEEYAKTTEKMAQSRERNRLAREIHDTLGHALTGIIAGIDACCMLIDLQPEEVKKHLAIIGDVARKGMKDVRRSVNALRPDALERLSLEEAIKQIIKDTRLLSNAEILLENRSDLSNLAEDENEAVYRTVQESITNSLRHGKADRIKISIDKVYNIITIKVVDNGIGCSEIKKGFGLTHMAERLEMLNGSLNYSGEDGFTIIAKIPIRWGR